MIQKTAVVFFVHFPKTPLTMLEPLLLLEGWERLYGLGYREAMVTARLYLPSLFMVHETNAGSGEGISFIRELRQHTAFHRSSIVYVTRDGDDDKLSNAIDAGADDAFTADGHWRVHALRINALIRKLKGRGQQDTRHDHFQIHPESLSVMLGGRKIQLVRKEFELLHLLYSDPHRIHHRQDILKHVWSDSTLKTDRTLDVHIRKLRKKLGQEHIRTITGVGYKFEWPMG